MIVKSIVSQHTTAEYVALETEPPLTKPVFEAFAATVDPAFFRLFNGLLFVIIKGVGLLAAADVQRIVENLNAAEERTREAESARRGMLDTLSKTAGLPLNEDWKAVTS